ncbi:5-formyltetrahydrofolate cyclo-ligase [Anaerosphaera multitolerans]|uniref:5-formyltetrahydrofolate cyclo-ligase n=1 Tax=Anaerosphaera multitolerans TaxID=2487351 RepID=A0A437S890_9FIRM|nr:5-formyltetrahydrofolate cyclo-ligase [Anaerosphaera multitolerans]RVU55124.1 5-formyltetrahydrofolate cyclo-ligase [Anaerosphaera multitolerans]
MNKKEFRKELIKKRDALSLDYMKEASEKIAEHLYNLDLYRQSSNIFIFVSYKSEVDTHNIIKRALSEGKNIFIPVVDRETKTMKISRLKDFSQLSESYMGILEPRDEEIDIVDPEILDLIITPGLAFDKKGYRIGYGGGFYDKFFSSLKKKVTKLGIGFDLQYVESLPHEDYDIQIDYFLSEINLYTGGNKD